MEVTGPSSQETSAGAKRNRTSLFRHFKRQDVWELHQAVASLVPHILAAPASFSDFTTPQGLFLSARTLGLSGEQYVVVMAEKGPPPPGFMSHFEFDSGSIAWILALVAVLTLSSLWLAGNLARPILACQKVSRSIAEGNLQARLPEAAIHRNDELGDLAADINAMAHRIEEMFATQRRLLQDISHELRTPLTRMQVAQELLLTAEGPDRAQLLKKMGSNVERLNALIQQILDFSRLDRLQGTAWEKKNFDLVAFARGLLGDLEFELQQSRRDLQVKLPETPLPFTGSQEFIRRAVENPLRNAVSHTPEETAIAFTLENLSENGQSWAVFTIRDHGPGVPAEILPHLFEAFVRGPLRERNTTPGLGLGLAITRRAVEAHQGTVTAENAANGGLEVKIRLPVDTGPVSKKSE